MVSSRGGFPVAVPPLSDSFRRPIKYAKSSSAYLTTKLASLLAVDFLFASTTLACSRNAATAASISFADTASERRRTKVPDGTLTFVTKRNSVSAYCFKSARWLSQTRNVCHSFRLLSRYGCPEAWTVFASCSSLATTVPSAFVTSSATSSRVSIPTCLSGVPLENSSFSARSNWNVNATIVGAAPVLIGFSTCGFWSSSSILFPDGNS